VQQLYQLEQKNKNCKLLIFRRLAIARLERTTEVHYIGSLAHYCGAILMLNLIMQQDLLASFYRYVLAILLSLNHYGISWIFLL
jgi:hypothetical protein